MGVEDEADSYGAYFGKKMRQIVEMGYFEEPATRDTFRQARQHPRNFRGYRRTFIDLRLRSRANDPHEPLRLVDEQNHPIFFFDQSQ